MKRLKKDQLKTAGVVALMIGAYVMFVLVPGGQQREALAERVGQDEQRLSSLERPDLEALRANAAEQRAKLAAERRDLPSSREVYLVLDGVSGALLDEGLADHRLTQSDPRRYRHYAVQPIDLEFAGGFAEAFGALRAIERLGWPVRIERLELVGDADDADGRVHASVRLSAFYEEGAGHE